MNVIALCLNPGTCAPSAVHAAKGAGPDALLELDLLFEIDVVTSLRKAASVGVQHMSFLNILADLPGIARDCLGQYHLYAPCRVFVGILME